MLLLPILRLPLHLCFAVAVVGVAATTVSVVLAVAVSFGVVVVSAVADAADVNYEDGVVLDVAVVSAAVSLRLSSLGRRQCRRRCCSCSCFCIGISWC